jgi:proline iminopeptidase
VSWGTTLALAYAEAHPHRVREMVLAGIALTRPEDVDWFTRGLGRFFPEAFERFVEGVPVADRDGDLALAYNRLLLGPDPAVCQRAARDWCDWEVAVAELHPGALPHPRYADPRFRLGFARTVTHYFANAAFLDDGQLLRDAGRLSGIPGVLVHGRLDLAAPLAGAHALARAWPAAELVVVDNDGHDFGATAISAAIVAATDRFASRE